MFCCKAFFLLLLFPGFSSEDLAEVVWRNLFPVNETSVPWQSYLRKILFKIIQFQVIHTKCVHQLAMAWPGIAFDFRNFTNRQYQRSYECPDLGSCRFSAKQFYRSITTPITHLQLTWFKLSHSKFHNSISSVVWQGEFTFQINVHQEYRANVTFHQIHLFSLNGICNLHNVVLQSYKGIMLSQHVFCARYATFIVYPSFNQVQLLVNIREGMEIKIEAVLSVMAKGMIENYQLQQGKKQMIAKQMILKNKFIIETYRIVIQKSQRVALLPVTNSTSYFIVYDGPGTYSPKQAANHQNVYFVSTFQCIVQVISRHHWNGINYLGIDITRIHKKLNNKNVYINMKLTNINLSTYHVYSPEGTNLNITISTFNYVGIASPECIYGGLALISVVTLSSVEKAKLCNKGFYGNNYKFHQPQILYSGNSTILVVYAYKQYSVININIKISYIRCKTTVINPCDEHLHSNNIFDQEEKFSLNLKLTTNDCLVILVSPDISFLRKNSIKFNGLLCRLLIDTKYNYENQLWYFWSSGFLQDAGFYNSEVQFIGFPTKEGNRDINGYQQSGSKIPIQPYCWHQGEWGRACSVNSTLIDKTFYFDYYISIPKRENSLYTYVRIYSWTSSYVQFFLKKVKNKTDGYTPLPFSFNEITHMYDIPEHSNKILIFKMTNNIMLDVIIYLDINIKTSFVQCKYITWNQVEKLTQYNKHILIALPFKFLSFSVGVSTASKLGHVNNITLAYDWVSMYLHYNKSKRTKICPGHPKRYLLKYETSFGMFYFMKDYGLKGCHINTDYCRAKVYSWTQANEYCRRDGKQLPQFLSVGELFEFLILLKLEYSIYVIQALYIGLLKDTGSKVSIP